MCFNSFWKLSTQHSNNFQKGLWNHVWIIVLNLLLKRFCPELCGCGETTQSSLYSRGSASVISEGSFKNYVLMIILTFSNDPSDITQALILLLLWRVLCFVLPQPHYEIWDKIFSEADLEFLFPSDFTNIFERFLTVVWKFFKKYIGEKVSFRKSSSDEGCHKYQNILSRSLWMAPFILWL